MLALFSVTWILSASLLTFKAIKEHRNAAGLFAKGIKTQAVVIGHQLHKFKGSYRETDYPIIRFTTATGQVVEVAKMTRVPLLNKFETIPVFYEAANPQNIVFDSEPGSVLPYLLPVAMWVIAAIVGLLLMLNK